MSWFERLFLRRRLYNEFSKEIREHFEEKIEELVAARMSMQLTARATDNLCLREVVTSTKALCSVSILGAGEFAFNLF